MWTDKHKKSFDVLKESFINSPILVYPDQNKPYIFFLDASKYGWPAVLAQEHIYINDGKIIEHQNPITCFSGLFQGS